VPGGTGGLTSCSRYGWYLGLWMKVPHWFFLGSSAAFALPLFCSPPCAPWRLTWLSSSCSSLRSADRALTSAVREELKKEKSRARFLCGGTSLTVAPPHDLLSDSKDLLPKLPEDADNRPKADGLWLRFGEAQRHSPNCCFSSSLLVGQTSSACIKHPQSKQK
jgi:hypothetical protein